MSKTIAAQVIEALDQSDGLASIDDLCNYFAHARGTQNMCPKAAHKTILRCNHSTGRDHYVTWTFMARAGKPAQRIARS